MDELDATDESLSVAEVRHMARKAFLAEALNELHAIGMNKEYKPSDRVVALKFVVEFASEAQGNGKTLGRLSPEVAKLIAKHGRNKVLPPKAEG